MVSELHDGHPGAVDVDHRPVYAVRKARNGGYVYWARCGGFSSHIDQARLCDDATWPNEVADRFDDAEVVRVYMSIEAVRT